ncbi:hypothetical protein Pan153_30400 [Gimesia panareensis]|uniref:Carboxypeptidase regulatory-like domain-containing protein n=1 Tax=Gimesia panareensis TaxID=2527978 RepID=A0A518FPV5_9PLAN|nr:carboxypeptidase-like regulatory domain-containing protein [Gimesia panareensis]QDV18382.1 hypothetical protein Pan153_30400 [Gimesia panareensis]
MNLFLFHGRSVRLLATVCLLALITGCGGSIHPDYSQLDLVDVSGTVTLDGQPLSGAQVAFEAPDGTYSSGVTDSGGNFDLMFNTEKSGCLTGEKTVRIRMAGSPEGMGEAPDDEGNSDEGGKPKSATGKIPAQYNKESTLKATVDADHTTFQFDLKSKP